MGEAAPASFAPVEIKGAFLDDNRDQIESFEESMKRYNNSEDRRSSLERMTILSSMDPRYTEVKKFLSKESVSVFIVDNNLNDSDFSVPYNGLQLIQQLIADDTFEHQSLLFVLYTAHPIDRKSEKLCEDLDILYINKSTDFDQLVLQIADKYNDKYPNRNFKAGIHTAIVSGPLDELYYKYADLLEKDLRKNPNQRATIDGKEHTVETLSEALRMKSPLGQFLVANYIESMEKIITIRRRKGHD